MPRPGGESDKLGNHYEGIWTVDVCLGVIDRFYHHIIVEPLEDPAGIEFVVRFEGHSEFHSAKRQSTREWTLAELARPRTNAHRSILGDLFRRTSSGDNDRVVFVSSTGANTLRDLEEQAKLRSSAEDFQHLSTRMRDDFADLVDRLGASNQDEAFSFLRRLRVVLISESELLRRVNQKIAKLLYRPDGLTVDELEVRLALGEFIGSTLGQELDRPRLLEMLRTEGYESRDWDAPSGIPQRVEDENSRYRDQIDRDLINDETIPRVETTKVFEALNSAGPKFVIVEGEAGVGKSCIVSQVVDRLREQQIKHLVVRMDDAIGLTTTREFGLKLHSLPQSPAVVLAGVTGGGHGVLVIDQVDAVSEMSGRDRRFFELFAALEREVAEYPNIRLLLACRTFDLEHDHRLRKLVGSKKNALRIKVGRLSESVVTTCLSHVGVESITLTANQMDVLRTPVHLKLFIDTLPEDHPAFRSAVDLFDRYWDLKRRQVSEALGREARWTATVDRMIFALTDRRSLAVESAVFDEDDLIQDARAMASANVFVSDSLQFRFFHESFFDYCVARRFYATRTTGDTVVDWLAAQDEQHLSLRDTVRQLIQYARLHDFNKYLQDIRELLNDSRVRFHLKSMITKWVGAIESPSLAELRAIQELLSESDVRGRLRVVMRPSLGWFDVLDSDGAFVKALNSPSDEVVDLAIWQLTDEKALKNRSARIAELLEPFYGRSEKWRIRLHRVVMWGEVHHSRRMFNLFLRLVGDGTIMDPRPSGDSEFWMSFYKLGTDAPELAAEAIGEWLKYLMANSSDDEDRGPFDGKDDSQTGERIVRSAATEAPVAFREFVIPCVIELVKRSQLNEWSDGLFRDRAFGVLTNYTSGIADSLLEGSLTVLQGLAKDAPDTIERELEILAPTPFATIAYLVMNAWAANPQRFANRCAKYLLENPKAIGFGYGAVSGGGNGNSAVTREILEKISPECGNEEFAGLEALILTFTDLDEEPGSRFDGITRYLLLLSLDHLRLSQMAIDELARLRARFPQLETRLPERGELRISEVVSPIAEDAAAEMSDDEWLSRLSRHPDLGDDLMTTSWNRKDYSRQISTQLGHLARSNKLRFANLVEKMGDGVSPIYFGAILDGLMGVNVNLSKEDRAKDDSQLDQVETLLLEKILARIHNLPQRACGRSIGQVFEKLPERSWSPQSLEIMSWYAINDPDPKSELWNTKAQSGQFYYRRDPYEHGINTNRGQAARAIRACLFADYSRRPILDRAISSLFSDHSTAVRSCAIEVLFPIFNHDRNESVEKFSELVEADPALWGTHHWEQFINYAIPTHYGQLRSLLFNALKSENLEVVQAASRQIALSALGHLEWERDLKLLMGENETARYAVADIAATNLGHSEIGHRCAVVLEELFFDSSEKVRKEAGTCFWKADAEKLERHSQLVQRYIQSPSFATPHNPLIDALAELTSPLPPFTQTAIDKLMELAGSDASNVDFGTTSDAAKVIFRLYDQTTSDETRRRCLDLIDHMEKHGFHGVDSVLDMFDGKG